ncbi:hypothetical protein VKT23_008789 [Stygiomarasmius scandens]|uniref:Zn(2)-C6 fungal-type domain-containing protein n=1 Tax=Marasmiellus scandens TaxID=2682957 RepID=A0ABR1JJR5_9AGAR
MPVAPRRFYDAEIGQSRISKVKSCINCRTRKRKCDQKRPSCSACRNSAHYADCEYEEGTPTQTQLLRTEVLELRQRNTELAAENARFRERITHLEQQLQYSRFQLSVSPQDSSFGFGTQTAPDFNRRDSIHSHASTLLTPTVTESGYDQTVYSNNIGQYSYAQAYSEPPVSTYGESQTGASVSYSFPPRLFPEVAQTSFGTNVERPSESTYGYYTHEQSSGPTFYNNDGYSDLTQI